MKKQLKIKNKQFKELLSDLRFRNDPRVKAIDKELDSFLNNQTSPTK